MQLHLLHMYHKITRSGWDYPQIMWKLLMPMHFPSLIATLKGTHSVKGDFINLLMYPQTPPYKWPQNNMNCPIRVMLSNVCIPLLLLNGKEHSFLNNHPPAFLLVYFWDFYFIYKISSFPFSPSDSPIFPSPPSNSWPLFYINCCCRYICICLYINISKYYLVGT